jgi:hypothetical protein
MPDIPLERVIVWLVTHLTREHVGVWLAALLTLCVYSFLYKDNVFYKIAEHLFVGVSVGWGLCVTYHQVILPKMVYRLFRPELVDLEHADYLTALPVLIGLLWFARFIPGYGWLTRIPIAAVVGYGSGISATAAIHGNLLPQVKATLLPLIARTNSGAFDVWLSVGNTVLIAGVICVLAYFYFSREHRGVLGGMSRIGIYFLMAAFGAAFGYTVMARVSLLIARVEFLLFDWLKLLPP